MHIPEGVDYDIKVLSNTTETIANISLPPVQPPPLDGEFDFPEPEFTKNTEIYESGALYPENNIVEAKMVKIRNRKIPQFQAVVLQTSVELSLAIGLETIVFRKFRDQENVPPVPICTFFYTVIRYAESPASSTC